MDKALILLFEPDSFKECGSIYKYDYKVAIGNIISYLDNIGVSYDCLIMDGLATNMNMHNPLWSTTGAPEDVFFTRNFCGVPNYPVVDLDKDSVDFLRNKFEIKRDLSPEERFPIISKRVKYMEKAMISTYAFIVVSGTGFRVKSKEGSGRAVLCVSEKEFYTSMDLSGRSVSINDFLQISYGNWCLNEWGEYCG